jgi:hypothetical protein
MSQRNTLPLFCTPRVETVGSSETLIHIYQTEWCRILEVSNIHACCRDNFKSHNSVCVCIFLLIWPTTEEFRCSFFRLVVVLLMVIVRVLHGLYFMWQLSFATFCWPFYHINSLHSQVCVCACTCTHVTHTHTHTHGRVATESDKQ